MFREADASASEQLDFCPRRVFSFIFLNIGAGKDTFVVIECIFLNAPVVKNASEDYELPPDDGLLPPPAVPGSLNGTKKTGIKKIMEKHKNREPDPHLRDIPP